MEIIRSNLIMRVLRVITPDEIGQMVDSSTVHLVSTLTEKIKENAAIFLDEEMDTTVDARVLPFSRPSEKDEEEEDSQQAEGKDENETEFEAKQNAAVLSEDYQVEHAVGSDLEDREKNWEWSTQDSRKGPGKKTLLEFLREENQEKPQPKKENMSTFILSEKEKMASAQRKLKSVEIHKLYQQNNAIDLEQVKKNRDDLGKTNNIGLLVRKKQS